MAQSDQSTSAPVRSAAAENIPRERDFLPERSRMMPLVAVLIALAFAACGWFFYSQGQRDALKDATATASIPTTGDATSSESTPLITRDSDDPGSGTTFAQTPTSGKPDIIVTVHPTAAQRQAFAAKSKPKTMLAKRAPVVAAPIDRQVALMTRPQPVYPLQALRAREQGTVLVLAQVDVNGHVSDAHIVQHSGSRILDRAAPNEVRSWQFEPALHNGQPIVASVEVPVSYRIGQ